MNKRYPYRDSYDENAVGPGWRPIVKDALAKLRAIDPKVRIAQIKEKFGGLRLYFYTDGPDAVRDQLDKVVLAAEGKCEETCEACGQPGKIRDTGGWLKCLCNPHAVPENFKAIDWQWVREDAK